MLRRCAMQGSVYNASASGQRLVDSALPFVVCARKPCRRSTGDEGEKELTDGDDGDGDGATMTALRVDNMILASHSFYTSELPCRCTAIRNTAPAPISLCDSAMSPRSAPRPPLSHHALSSGLWQSPMRAQWLSWAASLAMWCTSGVPRSDCLRRPRRMLCGTGNIASGHVREHRDFFQCSNVVWSFAPGGYAMLCNAFR